MLDFQRLMFRSHVQKARQSQCKVNLIFGASPAQNSWNSSPGRAWSKRCPKSLSENTSSRSTMSRWWVLRYWWNIVTCPGTQRSSVQQLHDASTHAEERTGRCLLLPVWFYKIDGCHPLVSLMGVNLQNDVPWCSQGIKQWECWDTSAIAQLVAAKVTILTAFTRNKIAKSLWVQSLVLLGFCEFSLGWTLRSSKIFSKIPMKYISLDEVKWCKMTSRSSRERPDRTVDAGHLTCGWPAIWEFAYLLVVRLLAYKLNSDAPAVFLRQCCFTCLRVTSYNFHIFPGRLASCSYHVCHTAHSINLAEICRDLTCDLPRIVCGGEPCELLKVIRGLKATPRNLRLGLENLERPVQDSQKMSKALSRHEQTFISRALRVLHVHVTSCYYSTILQCIIFCSFIYTQCMVCACKCFPLEWRSTLPRPWSLVPCLRLLGGRQMHGLRWLLRARG